MKKLLAAVFCVLTNSLWGQGSRFDANVFTSANSVPYGTQSTLYTVPFALIKVCAYPAAGNPCTNAVNVYSDPGLTQVITQPITADVHGRFGFWAAPGEYTYNAQSPLGTNYGNFTFTLAGTGGGSATFPSTPGIVYNLSISSARNATAADVTGLFSGCSGTLFLRADGTCGSSGLTLTTTGTTGLATLSGSTLNIPNYTLTTAGVTALGTLTNDTSGSAAKIGGVAVSGVPGVGQVPVALSSTTASWQTVGTNPGGSDTQVQFNDGGTFGGNSNFTWDKTNNVLAVGYPKLVPLTGGYTISGPIESGPQPSTFGIALQHNLALDVTNVLTQKTTGRINSALALWNQTQSSTVQHSHALEAINEQHGTSSSVGSYNVGIIYPGVGATASEMVAGVIGYAQLGDYSTTGTDEGTVPRMASLYAANNSNYGITSNVPINTGLYVEGQFGGVLNAGVYIADQTGASDRYGLYVAGGQNNLGPQTTTVGSLAIPSTGVAAWNSDTGLSRDSAGVLDVGNGTAGDTSGTVKASEAVVSGSFVCRQDGTHCPAPTYGHVSTSIGPGGFTYAANTCVNAFTFTGTAATVSSVLMASFQTTTSGQATSYLGLTLTAKWDGTNPTVDVCNVTNSAVTITGNMNIGLSWIN